MHKWKTLTFQQQFRCLKLSCRVRQNCRSDQALCDVKAAENLLREYELATTTNFCCNKAKKGFGTTDMCIIFNFHIN